MTPSTPKTLPDWKISAIADQHTTTFDGVKHLDEISFARAVLAAQPPAVAAIPEGLVKLGQRIQTQDNRATDAPIFIVQQKRSYVTEDGYNECRYEWHETESGDHSGPDSDEELERLEAFFSNEGHEPKGWRRLAMMDIWDFVTACFTEQGCKDYLAINGHNLKEPRIYAEGSYRNEEFRAVRSALIGFAQPPAGQQDRGEAIPKYVRKFIGEVADDTALNTELRDWAKRLLEGAPATAGEAAAAQGADWLPIETAPKNEGIWIAALGVHGDIPATIRWIHGDWDDGWGTEIVQPTHWMPLPAAPSPAAPGNGEGKS